jgi:hypothetical protein
MAASAEQLHELLVYCMGFGKTMLERAGEFYPFGAVIRPDGKLGAVGGYDGNDKPRSEDIYQLLTQGFASQAKAGEIVAMALAAHVNIPRDYNAPSPDGVRVHLETEGFSRFIYVPYTLSKEGWLRRRTVASYADPITVGIPPQVFRGPEHAH